MANQRDRERREQGQMSAKSWAEQQSKGGERMHLKTPAGVDEYKLEPGTHRVDFLCYVTGENNKRADPGFIHFEREYAGHRIEGPDGKTRLYCCRWDCFKQPCPACKIRNSRDIDKEVAKSLQPTTRHLWLVNDQPGKVKNVKPKVLDSGHFNRGVGFGELMMDAINICKGDPFAMQGGFTAVLTVKEQTAPFGKYNAVTRIDFESRDYDYPEELVKKMPCLDEMLVDCGAKAMRELLEGGESEDEQPASNRGKDDDDEDDDETPKASRRKAAHKGTSDETEDEDNEDEDLDEADDKETDEDDEDDEEESMPVKVARNGKPGKAKKQPTAAEFGIKSGMTVTYNGVQYTVIKVSGDGTSLTLEDEDEDEVRGVGPEEVAIVGKKVAGKKAAADDDDNDEDTPLPKAQKSKKPARDEEDDDEDEPDDEDEDDQEDESEDEDDEDDALEDEDDDDDPVPVSKKKKLARR